MSTDSPARASQHQSGGLPTLDLWHLLAMTLLGFACCDDASRPPPANPGAKAPVADATNEPDTKPSPRASTSYDDYAEAALAIGYLLRADTPAWHEISAKYEIARPRIEAVDKSNHTEYAKEIPKALGQIKAGKGADINTHIVTKGLQHVTVLTISNLLDGVIGEDTRTSSRAISRIKSVFAVIQPTLKRRDATVYNDVATLVPAAEQALARLQTAKNKPGLASAAMHLSKLLSKTYALSVLYEMKGVEEFCGEANKDPGKCAVKRTEAGMYYRIIESFIEARDKAAATEVENLIGGTRPGPKYATVRDLLARALPFTVEELSFR